MLIKTTADLTKALDNGAFAWPGGYPMYFLCADGEALSFAAVVANRAEVESAITEGNAPDWQVIAVDVNWEDNDLYCAHTGEKIECAYPSDDE